MSLWRSERGAAAVEFALIAPILLALILGTIEFGRAYNVQISLTHAARETARDMAINNVWTDAVVHGMGAAPSLDLESGDFTPSLATCASGQQIQVTVTQDLQTLTGVADDMTLTGKAAMRCGG
ncbi:pilus assembly protein [Kocuria sp. CPCC 205292]|uniref:TadE/TadG family type IV pilus assembly protein n=1 Tax=Kocuria cellulosilytica TaxID=3071451 RepID=UPI0034D47C63